MLYLVMGVAGAGKTTVAQRLAQQLAADFLDADAFHSEANKAKMAAGIGLTDADRLPWLASLQRQLAQAEAEQRSLVLACSALKRAYRQILSQGLAVQILYLHGSRELLLERLMARQGHFAGASLLDSQLATLEVPSTEEALWLDLRATPDALVAQVLSARAAG